MNALFAVTMWLMAGLGWAGFLLVGDWRGSVGGAVAASGAVIALVILMGKPSR